ncbi:GNAT family N-acetyltransferase [Pelagibacterium limicola]|uniref:GNAT family N-acetyltransferase n=1 Tax=Pelagibacterium limicola TaxID=2791022 RepID=UPI0018AFD766|nr:GNAT family N-acetyltransferase [Pelagibacterium limicola]
MTNAAFTIRPFRDSDADALCRLHVAAILATSDEHYTELQRKSWASGKKPESYIRIAREEETYLVAVDANDQPLGFCSFADAEIKGLYVRPAAQRRGIGTALMRRAEAALIRQGATEIVVHSGLPAVSFYQACGYAVVSRSLHRTHDGEELQTVRLGKHISE